MDKIYLHQMMFYGYHGLFPEERKLGQRFSVDLTMELDLAKAGKTDEMKYSIDYGAVYKTVKEVIEGKAVNLVETLAEKTAEQLFGNFPLLQACTVKVYKPDPPIPGHYKSVAVEIHRVRQ
ncbi:dihydroneopterin aldolase [Gracilibacillus ureilyticus]|uniref:7,8-dihydroneopterin aldolase n=1 Tax=Gracilibacillus ureilyticus TaxID=531814 RepID=A0A1H9VMW9_9BACI|nr:dihydroneopterin aldolase [Gracilibacillus ureilyticus]SES22543.1 dihydroneopterin aldolase [Gracilibacillus ureilyticus]